MSDIQLYNYFFPAKIYRWWRHQPGSTLVVPPRPTNEGQVGDEAVVTIDIVDDVVPCIHKVPKNLQEVNEEAYTPKIIAIGPYHHGNPKFADMEEHKKRYKDDFYTRITADQRRALETFIRNNKKRICNSYAEQSNFSNSDFVKMVLFDSVFIIELFLRHHLKDKIDFLLEEVWLRPIRRDLLLLENQLPYFVVEELYKLAFPSSGQDNLICPPFHNLSYVFFQLSISPNIPPMDGENIKVKHFTDLCRRALVGAERMSNIGIINSSTKELPNAVKLRRAGVKFKPLSVDEKKYLVYIKLEKRRRRILRFFYAAEMQFPRINISDDTECLIRNMMALEQCYYPSETYICCYIEMMDFLIENEEDVDFLVEKGIIYNNVGSNDVIVDMFNKLCRQIPPSTVGYYEIYKELPSHYENRWNHYRAHLKRVYFGNLWRGTGTVVAAILLLLTITQTVFSILQVLLA